MTRTQKKQVEQPPSEAVKSIQYDLFSNFVTNDASKVSNAIEMWEAIPKYFFTPAQTKKLRTADGLAKPFKKVFLFGNRPCTAVIQPALIEDKEGEFKACFPGVTEELVEEALKKIFVIQNLGIHDPDKAESWVKFTLSQLHKELKERGKERNRTQIKHALKIMSRCVLTLQQGDKEIYSGPILPTLVTVNRKEYVEDSNAQHAAKFPIFISESINRLQYRQFNYDRYMLCDEQLTRWLYKLFVVRYSYASIVKDYHFKYSYVKQNSGLLDQRNDREGRKKMVSALKELKERNVLIDWTEKQEQEGRKITDVVYDVKAAPEFIGEQKAANKRDTANTANRRQRHLR